MLSEYKADHCYDVCIVGSGPAGIIASLEYARLNPDKTVLLVEYGSKNQSSRNELDEKITVENLTNHHPPNECTNKGFGGTSATWGGRCVLYDEVDFVDRPVLNGNCTWDTALYEDVCQYIPQAAAYFECGKPDFTAPNGTGFVDGLTNGDVLVSKIERWSMPTRFGKRYAQALVEQPNITLLEGYEARDFIVDEEGVASALVVRQRQTTQLLRIQALAFVVSAGCTETTRLLLRNKQLFRRLKQVPPALGKFYQGHASGKIASIRFNGDPQKTEYAFIRDEDGTYCRRRFQFSTEFLTRMNLLNTAIWLDNPLYFNPDHRSGAMSFMYLAMITPFLGKRLAPPAIAHSITKGKVFGISRHLWNIAKGIPNSLWTPASIFYRRYCLNRKLPGIFLYSPTNQYALHFHAEQIPDPTNRMELASDGETLQIHYHLTEVDVQSVIKLHDVLDNWLRKSGHGELIYWYPAEQRVNAIQEMSRDGLHQVGTTRIADSPEEGVVDRNLKVWGTQNVFACSSSAFATSGQANPTFFLGAFAVRLACYLSNLN